MSCIIIVLIIYFLRVTRLGSKCPPYSITRGPRQKLPFPGILFFFSFFFWYGGNDIPWLEDVCSGISS